MARSVASRRASPRRPTVFMAVCSLRSLASRQWFPASPWPWQRWRQRGRQRASPRRSLGCPPWAASSGLGLAVRRLGRGPRAWTSTWASSTFPRPQKRRPGRATGPATSSARIPPSSSAAPSGPASTMRRCSRMRTRACSKPSSIRPFPIAAKRAIVSCPQTLAPRTCASSRSLSRLRRSCARRGKATSAAPASGQTTLARSSRAPGAPPSRSPALLSAAFCTFALTSSTRQWLSMRP
mmetsp:Transcript_106288/g.216751  ORF Transcript_106288/g.216751 Transcript_106288/m.216751 type:complete len:238 (+) Transcript_106288:252-965(+)